MITKLCHDYLQHLAGLSRSELGPCASEAKEFIRAIGNRAVELTSLLTSSWPTEDTSAGPYTLQSARELSTSSDAQLLLADGYLLLGSAGNGDPLVVMLRAKSITECEVGLISHEEWFEKQQHPQKYYAPISKDVLEFLYRAVEEKYLPTDYFMAVEHNQLKSRLST
jgi:hypothetical protein